MILSVQKERGFHRLHEDPQHDSLRRLAWWRHGGQDRPSQPQPGRHSRQLKTPSLKEMSNETFLGADICVLNVSKVHDRTKGISDYFAFAPKHYRCTVFQSHLVRIFYVVIKWCHRNFTRIHKETTPCLPFLFMKSHQFFSSKTLFSSI